MAERRESVRIHARGLAVHDTSRQAVYRVDTSYYSPSVPRAKPVKEPFGLKGRHIGWGAIILGLVIKWVMVYSKYRVAGSVKVVFPENSSAPETIYLGIGMLALIVAAIAGVLYFLLNLGNIVKWISKQFDKVFGV